MGDGASATLAQLLASDPDAVFDSEIDIDVSRLAPTVTWGTSPQDVVAVNGLVPDPADFDDARAAQVRRALDYMGLEPGQRIDAARLDRVFIGSCTNSRIEDLRAAAAIAAGHQVAAHVRAMVVPGSGLVREQAEAEGLDVIFRQAGFDWREPGCSMCLGMNPDRLAPGERCASTSNRNSRGPPGRGGRTHLMSPARGRRRRHSRPHRRRAGVFSDQRREGPSFPATGSHATFGGMHRTPRP